MVPILMSSLRVQPSSSLTRLMVASVSPRRICSSRTVPTSGIMISGMTLIFSWATSIAASVIARTCMSRISG